MHQLGGLQVLVENISRLLKSTLHRPRLRLDLQLRGLAEQTGQARPIQIGLGDNGSISTISNQSNNYGLVSHFLVVLAV